MNAHFRTGAIAALVALSIVAVTETIATPSSQRDAEKLLVVDCLLPGQMRKMGRNMTFVTARRAIKTTATDCEIRGGEYIAYDRSNYGTALKVWLPMAKGGDPKAQTYVGEIYEKGLGVSPDYGLARRWYQKAADQGYSRAQINLGYIYESGLGVPRDLTIAMNWYRQASGLTDGSLEFVSSVESANREAISQEAIALRQQVNTLNQTLEKRKAELNSERVQVSRLRQDLKSTSSRSVSSAPGPVVSQRDNKKINQLSKRLSNAEKEQQRLLSKLAQQQLENADVRKSLSESTRQLSERETQLQAAEHSYQRERRGLSKQQRDKLTTMQQEITDLRRQVKVARQDQLGDLEKTSTERMAMERSLGASNKEVSKLKSDLAAVQQQLSSGQTSSNKAQSQLSRRLADAEKEQQRLVSKLAQQQLETAGVRKSLSKSTRQLSEREAQLQAVEESYQRGQKSLSQQQRSELAVKQKEIIDLRQQVDVARRNQQNDMQKVGDQRVVLERSLGASNQEVSNLKSEMVSLQQQLSTGQARSQKMTSQMVSMKTDLQKREVDISRQQQEIMRLQTELAVKQQDLKGSGPANVVATRVVGPQIEIIDPPLSVTRSAPSILLRTPTRKIELIGKVAPAERLFSFHINGQSRKLAKNGLFREELSVLTPKTPVSIVAIDEDGRRSSIDFEIIPSGKVNTPVKIPSKSSRNAPAASAVDFGNYYALIIGNNNYRNMPDLSTPIADAKDVASILKSKYGFKTTLLLNADRYAMLSALNEMRESLTAEDNLLIYYAGHGELDKVNQRGHWLPVDAEPDSTTNWISNVAITDVLNVMSAKHVLVVADSCYSGSMTRSSLARLETGMTDSAKTKWFKTMSKARTRVVLSSGGVKPVLDSGGGGHSIFANAFLNVLRSNTDVLEGFSLYRAVQDRVKEVSASLNYEQNPRYSPIKYAGHESGEFFFLPGSVKAKI